MRTSDPSDGRSTLATLTELGAEKVREATPGHAELVHRLVLEPLTKTQLRQLREISRRIMGAIQEEGGWQPPAAPPGSAR